MTEPISPPMCRDEQLVQTLIGLSDGSQVNQVLGDQPKDVSVSVIRRLKDHISQLVSADIPRAITLAEITHAAATACLEPVGVALAHHARAQALHCAGRYTEARLAYEQAETIYRQSGHAVEAARVTRAKLDVLMYLGEYDAALASAEQARAVFQAYDQPVLLAQLETNVGNIYHRLDRYHEALTFYDRARALFAAHQDRKGEAINNFNAANQYSALNEFDQACALYEEARRGFEQLGMPVGVNNVEYSLAWLYFQRGRFQESLKLFERARARGRELGDVVMEALCALDVAEVYLQLNQYEEAHRSALAAVEQFSRLGMAYETAKAKMYLGLSNMHLNDLAGAEQQLQQARNGFIAEKNHVLAALAALYLSGVYAAQHQLEQAIELCVEARQLFIDQHLPIKVAAAELQLARLKLSQDGPQAADSWCRSALQRIGETEAPWLQFQCWHLLGNVMEQLGQPQEASQYYVKAIEYLDMMRGSIRVDEFKSTFLKDKLRVYEDLIQLCLRAGTPEKIDEAFAYAQAAKSRSLVELLSGERNIASKSHEPSIEQLHQEWNRLREELDYYYSRVNQFDNRTHERPSWLGVQLQNDVHQREQQLARLARQLSIADAEYASLHATARINLHQIQRNLSDDEVLVEYLLVNDHVQAFVIGPDSVSVFHDLATAADTASVLQWLKFNWDQFRLSEQCPQAYPPSLHALSNHYLQSLYHTLVEPIESALDGKRLIIAPHGVLHYVPFHALYDGKQYLVERYEMSYAPSASVYKLCVEKGGEFVGCGDGGVVENGMLIMGVADEAAPLIAEEVATLKQMWPEAEVVMGEGATLSCLRQQGERARWLHLATHGVFRRDNPMFSALKLSDRWLTLYDIFNLRLRAELVTLSACETGMNEVFPGDELFGLMRGFLYAGAPSLVVSLWMVHDGSTAQLMRQFYAGLRQGLGKRAALRQAQLSVKRAYPHPYHWAPFILMGAP